MTELLYALFYLVVLAAVIGCGAYLFITRQKPRQRLRAPKISPEALKRAESLSGMYRLSDLESILTELASFGAWGVILQLHLKTVKDNVEAIIGQNAVELLSHNLGVLGDYFDRFRRAAATLRLEVYPLAGQKDLGYIEITGSWTEIAATIRRFIREMYDLGDSTEVEVSILG